MFSLVSVCSQEEGSPCDHYPWCIGPHCRALPRHQTIRNGSTPSPWTSYMWPPASDIWWPSLEICSNLLIWGLPPLTIPSIWWPKLKWAVRIILEYFLVNVGNSPVPYGATLNLTMDYFNSLVVVGGTADGGWCQLNHLAHCSFPVGWWIFLWCQ